MNIDAITANVMPSNSKALIIEFFYLEGETPFICGVNGKITVDELARIEKESIAEGDALFDKGEGSYLFNAIWFSGQYGEYGRCELPPCFELYLTEFIPVDVQKII